MKKALLMAMSGTLIVLISFNAQAAMQPELEEHYLASHTGETKKAVHDKFEAWEKVLKAELAAKHAVTIDGLGTYAPKEKTGTRVVNGFGGLKTVDQYTLVKNAEKTDTAAFIDKFATASGMSKQQAKAFNDQFITQIQTTLKKGGSVIIHGEGTYRVGKQAATYSIDRHTGDVTRTPARRVGKFNASKSLGTRQQFTPDAALNGSVN
jgi:DNA-binding protein HU-beta